MLRNTILSRLVQFKQSSFFSQYFIPALVLCIMLVIFFYPFTLLGNLFWSRTDTLTYYFPTKFWYAEKIKQLILPVWTSAIGSGFPLFAGIQVGMLYPINLILYFLFSFPIAFNLTILVQLYLAGLFMYLYTKTLSFSRIAGLFTALTFMFSGFMVVRIPHQDLLSTCIWLPCMFFLIEKRFACDNRRYLVAASIVVGLQVLAGSAPSLVVTFSASLLYFIFRFIVYHASHFYTWKKLWLLAGELMIIFFLGIGLTSVQMLPTIELYQYSVRRETAQKSDSGSPDTLLTGLTTPALFFFPNFFGRDRAGEGHADPTRNFWGNGSFQENTIYLGILPLIFLFSALRIPHKHKKEYVCFFVFLIIIYLLLSLGPWGGLYSLLHKIPFVNAIRAPARFLYVVLFSVSVLAGYGIDLLLETTDKKQRAEIISTALKRFCVLLITVLALAATYSLLLQSSNSSFITDRAQGIGAVIKKNIMDDLWSLLLIVATCGFVWMWGSQKNATINLPGTIKHKLFSPPSDRLFARSLILIAFIDLFVFGNAYMRAESYKAITATASPVLEVLSRETEPFRIGTLPIDPAGFRLETLSPLTMADNVPLAFGIDTTSIYSTLALTRYENLISGFSQANGHMFFSDPHTGEVEEVDLDILLRLYDMLNVAYVFADHQLADPSLRLVFQTQDRWIYQNDEVLPRAFLVPSYEVIEDPKELLTTLLSSRFDPQKTVLLEETPSTAKDATTQPVAEQASFAGRGESDLSLSVSTPISQFLFLSENYYPGWRAYIDGGETKIYRANWNFKAIFVPAGAHEIRFSYTPTHLKTGGILSGISALSLLVLFIVFSQKNIIAKKIGYHKQL